MIRLHHSTCQWGGSGFWRLVSAETRGLPRRTRVRCQQRRRTASRAEFLALLRCATNRHSVACESRGSGAELAPFAKSPLKVRAVFEAFRIGRVGNLHTANASNSVRTSSNKTDLERPFIQPEPVAAGKLGLFGRRQCFARLRRPHGAIGEALRSTSR